MLDQTKRKQNGGFLADFTLLQLTLGDVIALTKIIDIGQIIAFGNFDNYGTIESMKKSILFFNYWNFPKKLSLAQKYSRLSDILEVNG